MAEVGPRCPPPNSSTFSGENVAMCSRQSSRSDAEGDFRTPSPPSDRGTGCRRCRAGRVIDTPLLARPLAPYVEDVLSQIAASFLVRKNRALLLASEGSISKTMSMTPSKPTTAAANDHRSIRSTSSAG